MVFETVLTEKRGDSGGILWVTLNRPEKLNALSMTLFDELRQVFQDARRSPLKRCFQPQSSSGHTSCPHLAMTWFFGVYQPAWRLRFQYHQPAVARATIPSPMKTYFFQQGQGLLFWSLQVHILYRCILKVKPAPASPVCAATGTG